MTSEEQRLTAAIEQRIAEMDDAEFNALVARTRPPQLADVKQLLHREMQRLNMPTTQDLTADFKEWETR
jgi:hypothetical protein